MLKRIDLTRDYKKHESEYLAAIKSCCEETAFSGGKYADRFDAEFGQYLANNGQICAKENVSTSESASQEIYVQGVNNGTSALHCALAALGIGPGDEVIVPANTYIASAWGVTYTGATPVFVDCTADTWEIDPSKIEEKITDKTKAILGVHLYGQPFDFGAVKKIADKYNLYVVEDCAQAHGAKFEGQVVGILGDLGCFSFYPGKNLYAFGEGGAVATKNPEYNHYIDVMKNQGCNVRYYHEMIGYNYRLEGIQGAVLSVSLKYLPEWTARRQEIGRKYMAEINNPKIIKQAHPENTETVFHLFEVEVTDDPENFLTYMKSKDIECNRHYPVPCHLQEAYKDLGYKKGDCPNAEYLADHCATLPLFPEMTDEEVQMVIDAANTY